jgi:hypothetical protein
VSLVELNPPGQYADDSNLSARQRLRRCQVPALDIAAHLLDLVPDRSGAVRELRRALNSLR